MRVVNALLDLLFPKIPESSITLKMAEERSGVVFAALRELRATAHAMAAAHDDAFPPEDGGDHD